MHTLRRVSVFAVQDLFTVGIGCDIAGGYLVVRGLLLGDIEMRRLAGTYVGLSHGELVARAHDRIDARAGLIGLVAGFALQAIAYLLTLAGAGSDRTGPGRAVMAGALAVAGAGLVLVAWRLGRERRLRHDIVEISRVDAQNRVKLAAPLRGLLIPLGEEAGFPRQPDESDEAYARRVFGVHELYGGTDC